jgi:hypothetical protein
MNNQSGYSKGACATVQNPEPVMPLFSQQQDGFSKYDAEHPDIWKAFEEIALNLILNGCAHYGSKAIFEVIRYEWLITKGKDDAFKVNNNFTADYARKFVRKYPEYKNFFELRERV